MKNKLKVQKLQDDIRMWRVLLPLFIEVNLTENLWLSGMVVKVIIIENKLYKKIT